MPASALMPANQPIFAKKSRPPMFIPSIMKKGAAAAATEKQRPLPKPDQRFDLSLSSDDDNDTPPAKISPRPPQLAKSAKVQAPPPKPAHKHQRGKQHSSGVKPEAHKIAITKKKTPASKPVVTSPRLLPKPDPKQVQSRPEVNCLNNHAWTNQ